MSDGSSGPTAAARRATSAAAVVGHPGQEVVPSNGALGRGAVGHDDRLQRRELDARRPEHGDVVGAEEVGDGDQGAGAAATQDVGRLDALEPGVHRDEDGAGLEQAEQRRRSTRALLGAQIETRSPGSTPRATSAAPNVRARSSSSA